jgi:hypothetical protein
VPLLCDAIFFWCTVPLLGSLSSLTFLVARTLFHASDSQRTIFASLLRETQPGPTVAERALQALHVLPASSPVETAPDVPSVADRHVDSGVAELHGGDAQDGDVAAPPPSAANEGRSPTSHTHSSAHDAPGHPSSNTLRPEVQRQSALPSMLPSSLPNALSPSEEVGTEQGHFGSETPMYALRDGDNETSGAAHDERLASCMYAHV